ENCFAGLCARRSESPGVGADVIGIDPFFRHSGYRNRDGRALRIAIVGSFARLLLRGIHFFQELANRSVATADAHCCNIVPRKIGWHVRLEFLGMKFDVTIYTRGEAVVDVASVLLEKMIG